MYVYAFKCPKKPDGVSRFQDMGLLFLIRGPILNNQPVQGQLANLQLLNAALPLAERQVCQW